MALRRGNATQARSLVAMIGAPRQYGHSTIDLLGQHHSRKGVRPSLGTERQLSMSLRQQGAIETFSTADDEYQATLTLVAQFSEIISELS